MIASNQTSGGWPETHAAFRRLLFADLPLAELVATLGDGAEQPPWSLFVQAASRAAAGDREGAIACLKEIVHAPNQESRVLLQAWHAQRSMGERPPSSAAWSVLGLVTEIGFSDGTDVLSAYADYSARYLSRYKNIIVWDTPMKDVSALIDKLLRMGAELAKSTRVSQDMLPGSLIEDTARVVVLTPGGPHLRQGATMSMSQDPLCGPILQQSVALLQTLMARVKRDRP